MEDWMSVPIIVAVLATPVIAKVWTIIGARYSTWMPKS